MSEDRKELIQFRIKRSDEAFEIAKLTIERTFYNSAVSELYYTCYYLIAALFAEQDINASTHSGMRTLFGLKFIKENKIDIRWAKLFSTLFNKRQESDYRDFVIINKSEVEELLAEVIEFRILVKGILQQYIK